MQQVFFILDILTPFYESQISLLNSLNSDKLRIKPIVIRTSDPDRKTWGKLNIENEVICLKNLELLKFIYKEKPDLIFITQYNRFDTFCIILFCILKNTPFYIGPHELFNDLININFKSILKFIYYKLVSTHSSGTITMGKFSTKLFKLIGVKNIYNIPYPINLDNFSVNNKIQNKKNIDFLFCGRLVEFRNPILVLEVFNLALTKLNRKKDVRLLISGEGDLQEKCKEFITQNNLNDNVVWLKPIKQWSEIPDIYFKADILIALQNFSGWGMIIPEAMASGNGIITTNRMIASDSLIIDNYNGFLVDIENKDEIVEKMLMYINNKELIEIHGVRSKEIVKTVCMNENVLKLNKLIFKKLR